MNLILRFYYRIYKRLIKINKNSLLISKMKFKYNKKLKIKKLKNNWELKLIRIRENILMKTHLKIKV